MQTLRSLHFSLKKTIKETPMEDIRKHPRSQADFMIMCEVSHGDNVQHQSIAPFSPIIVNLSQGGICIATDENLQENKKIKMIFAAASSYEHIELTGEIVWCKLQSNGMYHSGVIFSELDPESCDLLKACLQESNITQV